MHLYTVVEVSIEALFSYSFATSGENEDAAVAVAKAIGDLTVHFCKRDGEALVLVSCDRAVASTTDYIFGARLPHGKPFNSALGFPPVSCS